MTGGQARLLVAFLAFSLLWFLRWYTVGPAPAGVRQTVDIVLYSGWSLAMAVVAYRALRRSPERYLWWPAMLALGLQSTGDLAWGLANVGVLPLPVDSPVILTFYVAGRSAMAFTVIHLIRHSERGRGSGYVLDGVIVAVGITAAILPQVVRPFHDSVGFGGSAEQLLAMAYGVIDIVVVAAFAVAALSPRQGQAARLLGLAASCLLVADLLYLFQSATGPYVGGGWTDWWWLAQYTLAAAAMLQPTTRTAREGSGAETGRVVVLVGCALLCPVLFAVTHFTMPPTDARESTEAIYAAFTVVLVALVCARIVHLLHENATAVRGLSAALEEQARLTQHLQHQAEHDAMTGLPNRYLLAEAAAATPRGALVFLDVDDFKAVNDEYGHQTGDLVLREIAQRLRRTCRPEDVVARLGGDEFAVLLRDADAAEAVGTAHRLLHLLAEPVVLRGRPVSLHASAGVAELHGTAGHDDDDGDGDGGDPHDHDVLAQADVAMYAAKRAGKNRVLVYAETMRQEVLGDAALATEVTQAIRRGGITAAFQPIVDLDTGHTVGLEALARWEHHERGPVSPAVFLPIAIERGMVSDLDLAVTDQALARMAEWRATTPGLRVAVNASAELLAREDVVDRILALLDRHGLDGEVLVVEVTEQSVINDTGQVAGALHQLRRHGVLIALDDFGTGYSSLSYLQDLPVDILKLDRSFVVRGVTAAGATPLLRTVVRLGRELGMVVLAEGIETEEQHTVLREIGCQRGQGWHFAKALPAAEIHAVLRHPPRAADHGEAAVPAQRAR